MPSESGTLKNARAMRYPSIMPRAVESCHPMTSAPRIFGGEHSAAYIGVVADLGPIERPRKQRQMNIFHHVSAQKPWQTQAVIETRQ